MTLKLMCIDISMLCHPQRLLYMQQIVDKLPDDQNIKIVILGCRDATVDDSFVTLVN
ncbi:MAG: hypothetical protein ACHQJ6_02250 [Candidatus Berkiellales bacterium]